MVPTTFTPMYFLDKSQSLALIISSDDALKIWVNDKVVLSEEQLSSWDIAENGIKVDFKKGFNRIRMRLENATLHVYFSVMVGSLDLLGKLNTR